jgi:hypothetical protein
MAAFNSRVEPWLKMSYVHYIFDKEVALLFLSVAL